MIPVFRIEKFDLNNITPVCQDWGGILGMTLPMQMPNRFRRLIVMNTALPIGASIGGGFATWKAYAAQFKDIPVSGVISVTCPGVLDLMDVAAYAAPFPDERYQAGVRRAIVSWPIYCSCVSCRGGALPHHSPSSPQQRILAWPKPISRSIRE